MRRTGPRHVRPHFRPKTTRRETRRGPAPVRPDPGKERTPMRRARAWEVRLAAVGLGLILSWTVAGCGGGDVPDPSADASASGEAAPDAAPAATRTARADAPATDAEGETPAPKASRKAGARAAAE